MLLRFVAICFAVLVLSGCLLSHAQHNGYPSASIKLWDSVKEGYSKAEVIKTLGHPVIEEGDSWVYPSCLVYRVAASLVQEYSCDVLKVTFDDEENVVSVERFHIPRRSLQKVFKSSTPITGVHDGLWRKIGKLIRVDG